MTPTMDAPVTGPADVTEIAGFLADAPGGSNNNFPDSPFGDTPPSGDSGTPSDGASASPASPTTSTGEPSAAGTPGTPATGAAGTDPFPLSEDGSSYIIPKTEFSTFNGAREYAQKVQQRFPTAADAETAHYQAADFRAIRADFMSAEPHRVDAVVDFFAGKDEKLPPHERDQFREAFAQMIPKGAEVLKSVNPQAYEQLATTLAQSSIEQAYSEAAEWAAHAAQTQSPHDIGYAELALQRAQFLEWGVTGKVRGNYDPQKGYVYEFPKNGSSAQSPEEQYRAQQEALAARENQIFERDFKSWDRGELDGPKWRAFDAEITKTLAPIKDKYDPEMFEAAVARIRDSVLKKLSEDYEFSRDHNNDRSALVRAYQTAWKNQQSASGLKPRLTAYQNNFLSRVRRELPSIAASWLGKATATAVAQASSNGTRQASAPAANSVPTSAPNRAPNGQFNRNSNPNPASPNPEPFDVVSEVQRIMRVS
jgi:hypothetical protein